MIVLSVEQGLFLHARLIEETGGSHGIHDPGLLQSTLARPQAFFEGKELYPDLFKKTAVLMHSLVNNHPFLDGNTRTAIAVAGMFLSLNGYQLNATNDELVNFTMACARSPLSLEQIEGWFREHATPNLG